MEAGTIVALSIEELVDFWILFADFRRTSRFILRAQKNERGASVRTFPFSWPRKIQKTSLNVTVTIFIPYMLIHCL